MFYFGYTVPEGTKNFWGCRAILESRGERYVDFVYDRQSIVGDEEGRLALSQWLNGNAVGMRNGALKKALEKADELFKSCKIRKDKAEEFTLYEDEKGIVKANSNASYGYLYVSAYFK